MTKPFSWTCPTCGAHTVITDPNVAEGSVGVYCDATARTSHIQLSYVLIECPNVNCKAQSFQVLAEHGSHGWSTKSQSTEFSSRGHAGVGNYTFLPTSAQPLSKLVPPSVASDYSEAYLIASLSPKASATLARRALQGMVRDFFTVTGKRTLHAELEAIKDQCDPDLYDAMMAVKSVGNIGAHPEQDVSLMVDVEPGEAETLLNLIHLLDQEWYVARAAKAARIAKMQALGASKEQARTPPAPSPP